MAYTKTLSYYQTILRKVSFDAALFYKELKKALLHLNDDEGALLNVWVQHFIRQNEHLLTVVRPV